jgi:hypothetical protein
VAHIRQIPPDEATGTLKRIYDEATLRAGKVFGILRIQSLNPPALDASMGMYKTIMFPAPPSPADGAGGPGSPLDASHRTGCGPSPLSRARREMLATVVSRANDCFY